MRCIKFSAGRKGVDTLHIEVPGAIVNVTVGLRDTEGRAVTRVDVTADQFAGEEQWSIPDAPTAEETAKHLTKYLAKNLWQGTRRELLKALENQPPSDRRSIGLRVIEQSKGVSRT